MPVGPSCEKIARYYLPAIRSIIAKRLMERYNLSQIQIAEKLGTTQAAVSQYLSSKRGAKTMREIEENPVLEKAVNEAVERIARSGDPDTLPIQLCNLCGLIREGKGR
ncbi:MAG: helix-turn-helix domain-containing protein [Candidatus Bathyarchaeia archaeon]|nr:helix-turn-helix domain-containing protein [Candidatus Bathyarchaeota archaeon]